MAVRDPLGAEAAARAVLKTYAEPVWAEVMEVGTGANLNKVRVKLPGEVAATADLPWAPVLGSVPTVGTQALTLKTSFGRWVVSGGTGGGGGGGVTSFDGETGAVIRMLADDTYAGTTAITSFPAGGSTMRVSTATSGWPTSGNYVIVTHRAISGAQSRGFQIASMSGGDSWSIRRWDQGGGVWSGWIPLGAVSSVFSRTGGVVAASGDYSASQITNTPAGSIAATTVQAAITELDADNTAHLNDTVDAHDASAISYAGGTGMSATDAEGALDELAAEKLDATSYTAADVLAKLLTVDGSGSNLDADKLDGNDSQAFFDFTNQARNLVMTGGGTISWGIVANKFKWTDRFLFIPVPTTVSSDRYVQTSNLGVGHPTSGVTDNLSAERASADGITLNAFESLWAIQTAGSTNPIDAWKVIPYNAAGIDGYHQSEEAYLIAVRGDYNQLYLRNGLVLKTGQSRSDGGAGLNAADVTNTPAGTIAATNVQAAITELDADNTAHLNDTSDAHDASAISFAAAGGIIATDVQAAIAELDAEKLAIGTGTQDATTFRRGDGTWAVPGGSNYRTLVTLAADRTNSATTFADATGLSFAVVAGTVYRFEALIWYTVNAITVGSRFAINGPAMTRVAYTVNSPISGLATGGGGAGALDGTSTTAASGAHVDNAAQVFGIVQPSANGTVIIRFAPETATLMTVRTGSTLEYW